MILNKNRMEHNIKINRLNKDRHRQRGIIEIQKKNFV